MIYRQLAAATVVAALSAAAFSAPVRAQSNDTMSAPPAQTAPMSQPNAMSQDHMSSGGMNAMPGDTVKMHKKSAHKPKPVSGSMSSGKAMGTSGNTMVPQGQTDTNSMSLPH